MEVTITSQMFKDLKPFIVGSRILGLTPIACKKIGNKYSLNISHKYIAYSYILGLILAGSALYSLISDVRASPENSLRIKDTKGAYVVCCDIGLMIFIVVLGIFISPFKVGKLFRILDSLQHIDTKLNLHDREYARKTVRLVSLAFVTSFSTVLMYDFIGWYIKTKGQSTAEIIWKNVPVYLLYIVSFSQEISFWYVTFSLKRRFMAFNDNFKENRLSEEKKTQLMGFSIYRTRRQVSEKNLSKRNMNKSSNKTTFLMQERLTAEKIEKLIHLFRALFKTINLINEWYEIPLLLILLSCLFQLISTPYFIITNTKTNILVFSILEIVWLFTHVGRLLIIIEASHTCIKEYGRINYLLCSHLQMNYDKDIIQQLKTLVLHLNACKMRFSTYGITELNRSILASITGAVTTYLVVLVQLNTNSGKEISGMNLTTDLTRNSSL